MKKNHNFEWREKLSINKNKDMSISQQKHDIYRTLFTVLYCLNAEQDKISQPSVFDTLKLSTRQCINNIDMNRHVNRRCGMTMKLV